MAEKPFLYIALDHNIRVQNVTLAANLSRLRGNFGFKINLDHYSQWSGYLDDITNFGRALFIDTKINNGLRTMGNIVKDIASYREVKHTNVWALAEKLIQPLPKIISDIRGHPHDMGLLAVTVTTHFTQEYCQKVFRRSLPDSVRMLSEMGMENGCDGIIVPGTTLTHLRDLLVTKVVPAVRPLWYEDKSTNDQEQTVTPAEAIEAGATHLVCGSPIYKSPDPLEALNRILEEMENGN